MDLSVKLYDDFVLLETKDQNELLLFEVNVMEWSDRQLRRELDAIRPTYELLCSLANDEGNNPERRRMIYHSRRMDLRMIIMENELTRREMR